MTLTKAQFDALQLVLGERLLEEPPWPHGQVLGADATDPYWAAMERWSAALEASPRVGEASTQWLCDGYTVYEGPVAVLALMHHPRVEVDGVLVRDVKAP